jgi:hypothetical protein
MLEKKEKQEVHVKFPNDFVFFKMRIEPEEIKDEIKFQTEVFVSYKGMRIAILKEDYNNLKYGK